MKTGIKVFCFLLISNLLFGQTMSQNESCLVYLESMSAIDKKDKPVLVKFEYLISDGLKDNLSKSTFYEDTDIHSLNKLEEKLDIIKICPSVRKKLVSIGAVDIVNKDDFNDYDIWNFGKPIYLNNDKAYLIFEILHFSNGRVRGGGSICHVLVKSNEKWKIVDKKILEFY